MVWNEFKRVKAGDKIKARGLDDEGNKEPSTRLPSIEAPAVMSLFNARVAKKRPTSLCLKSELDRYLEDDYVPATKENFNVLDWWKVAGTRYPNLRMIVRDIYAIPVSTVASELAFSTSGRVLSEHRSRLTPEMLEALMCSQDWLRNQYKDDANGLPSSIWTVLQDISEGMQELTM